MINATTKRRGRPATGKGEPVQVRLQPDQLRELDDWIAKEGKGQTRPEAIRDILRRWFFH